MQEHTRLVGKRRLPVGWLVVTKGVRTGTSFLLRTVANLGRRGVGNDIILEDPYVSTRHAKIRLEGGRYVLYDLGALNGTWLNGQRISRIVLMDGDDITVGTTELRFKEVRG